MGVVGLGYVGLPTALDLMASGSKVIGFDVDLRRLAAIGAGDVDLHPADHARLRTFRHRAELTLTSEPHRLADADTVIICVPTPVDRNLVPELRALSSACSTVVEHAVYGQMIILTSTTYVGTTRDLLARPLTERGFQVGHDVHVAFSPERIDPGNSRHVAAKTPRVVGGMTGECTRRAVALLGRVAPAVHPVGSPEAAEMAKLLENTFRAVNIALANEFADASRYFGLDPMEVIGAAATKPFGFMPFYPGPGVGGHCIPCDPHYLLWQLRGSRLFMPLIDAAMTVIAKRPGEVVERVGQVLATCERSRSGARVLIVGVTYKPGVADVRESPALEIMQRLADCGSQVAYTDPLVPSLTLGNTSLTSRPEPMAEKWDLVVVHTLHPDVDLSWLQDQEQVLDATYRLTDLKNRTVV
ncbi:nucleotide sugar dehydrogenase [Actinoplanes sp. NPDC051633]|uniref:nucleotide sugar dehydrogenase n=1 Tax=Actinoplanes sp. NPDC051633 TaxID=3155670 RepID=UPI003444F970